MKAEKTGRVAGKTAIVTGAAAGIGETIARLLAAEGATVFITDLNAERGEALAREIGAHFCQQDVTREADWARVMAAVAAQAGAPQILVNNAGIGHLNGPGTPEHASLDEWREMVRINGESVFLGCRYGIEAMKAGGGSIINMSSIAALVPVPQLAPYGFSKAGVAQYSRSVALYCLRSGYSIRCNSVHPGQIQTAMLDGLFSKGSAQSGIDVAELRKAFLSRIPMGEFGTPDDIAHGVLYFASDESRYVTGTRLVIDGGIELMNGS
jgi:3(or 17)beta-hydroxysteroid dehydrogenase